MFDNVHETTASLPGLDRLEELACLGQAIYEDKLKSLVEPQQNNRFIAIHVDTEDYTVARSSAEAVRAMLKIHPADGRLYIRKIGDEPEYGLAARLLAGEKTEPTK